MSISPVTPHFSPAPEAPEENSLARSFQAFHRSVREHSSTPELASVLKPVIAQIENSLGFESWTLLFPVDGVRSLQNAVQDGHTCSRKSRTTFPLEGTMVGAAAERDEVLIFAEHGPLTAHSTFHELSSDERAAMPFRIESAIALPLRSRDKVVGVLEFFNFRLEALNEGTMTLLNVLSDFAALAVQNAQSQERIEELTIKDDCTQLFNTRHLHVTLQEEFQRARRFHSEFSVVFMDLDRFKVVNDRFGHPVGVA